LSNELDFDSPFSGDLLVVAETGNFLRDLDYLGEMDPCVFRAARVVWLCVLFLVDGWCALSTT